MSGGTRILELQQVTKRLGGLQVLRGVTFGVQAGTITGLIGPNGAGKTTTLNVIASASIGGTRSPAAFSRCL